MDENGKINTNIDCNFRQYISFTNSFNQTGPLKFSLVTDIKTITSTLSSELVDLVHRLVEVVQGHLPHVAG